MKLEPGGVGYTNKLVSTSLFEVVLYLICNTLAISTHVGKAVKTLFASDDS